MQDFKIIGLRVLPECDYHIRKVLKSQEAYIFYEDYKFSYTKSYGKKSVVKIENQTKSQPQQDFYSFRAQSSPKINISAVVGANGSGKSTLFELLYAFCFCISQDDPGILEALEKSRHELPYLKKDILRITVALALEVYYESNGKIYSILYNSKEITGYKFNPERKVNKSFNVKEFCYTIALNYSLYGLNDYESPWLRLMFHKNDGYQAPLVINPLRTKGIIDVNQEFTLSQARVLLNLAETRNTNIEIVKGKVLSEILFSFRPSSLKLINYYKDEFQTKLVFKDYETSNSQSRYTLYNRLLNIFFESRHSLSNAEIKQFNDWDTLNIDGLIRKEEELKDVANVNPLLIKYFQVYYVLKKLFKICLTYSTIREEFISFPNVNTGTYPVIKKGRVDELLMLLASDKSHMTFKLKQAINLIVNQTLSDVEWKRKTIEPLTPDDELFERYIVESVDKFEFVTTIPISQFKVNKKSKSRISTYFEDVHDVPGAFVKCEFNYMLPDGHNSEARKMSSGEQQYFQSINTIVYHLRNINSVAKSSLSELKSYENVNILLDEIELYYHPEYQRNFVYSLVKAVDRLKLPNIKGVNVIFSTHSPFILSDIPSSNILRLKEGHPQPKQEQQTFGANIHDLLANDFFLEKGFIGEFAKEKINDLIIFLRYNPNKQTNSDNPAPKINWSPVMAKKFISIIGEPILKMKLAEMYDSKFSNDFEVELLKQRIKELEKGKE